MWRWAAWIAYLSSKGIKSSEISLEPSWYVLLMAAGFFSKFLSGLLTKYKAVCSILRLTDMWQYRAESRGTGWVLSEKSSFPWMNVLQIISRDLMPDLNKMKQIVYEFHTQIITLFSSFFFFSPELLNKTRWEWILSNSGRLWFSRENSRSQVHELIKNTVRAAVLLQIRRCVKLDPWGHFCRIWNECPQSSA